MMNESRSPATFCASVAIATWLAVAGLAAAAQAGAATTLGLEAEQFQFAGDWAVTETRRASGGKCLNSGPRGAKLPAATAIDIPRAGHYYLWVRAMDFPNDRPGTRTFSVSVGGQRSPEVFGDSRKPGFTWERGGAFDLKAGPTLLAIHSLAPFARADALLLTTDAAFVPSQPLGKGAQYRRIEPREIAVAQDADPLVASSVQENAGTAAAGVENEFVRIEFVPGTREGKTTVCPRVALKTKDGWTAVPADPGSEIYAVVAAGHSPQFDYSSFFPRWQSSRQSNGIVRVEAGGVKLQTASPNQAVIWNAGELVRFLPRTAEAQGNRVRLEFYPSRLGTLSAEWELRPGERTARVQLTFIPTSDGQFALGYHLFFRQPVADVSEIMVPMMWQRRRMPAQARTLLDPYAPTPLALAETRAGGEPRAWALIGDPAELPFAWPGGASPHFGLMIRDNAGAVQPSIYGPVPGTPAANATPAKPLKFSFRVLVQAGDWYAGYRTAADEVFGLRDYRHNVGVSLTDAALNMIALIKDDEAGGWWYRAKAFYQIESKNGSTHASPLTLLSLYRLTGDEEIWRRRALPTMEFLLSRRSAHFSPLPQDTGEYDPGGMDGPVHFFGTTTFGGAWELTGRRTAVFRDVALPGAGVRSVGSYNHSQSFDEWLGRYELTGETNALQQARALADRYIKTTINQAPTAELGAQPFFFIQFVPDWEGLLRLFEATGEKRYLDAAAFGARQLMTGIWTQPAFPAGEATIHPGGQFPADTLPSFRGPAPFRLGTPRKPNDTPEHQTPAWIVSNVGLGFEQPSTLSHRVNRLIYQMFWAPDFLRLARHTGDRMFETYARNAVIGRWANYPGYYVTGFTDLPLNPRYPLEGPDVTDFYYHHIAPHLAWTIDYLVAEAALRSHGKISFPSQRQVGYAYFDSREYGHAPGNVFDSKGVWLWFKRGLVSIDNPQVNYLAAHSRNQFLLVLMNENTEAEQAAVRFSSEALKFDPQRLKEATLLSGDGMRAQPLPLEDGSAKVLLPPRGMTVLRLDGVNLDVPSQCASPASKPGPHPGSLALKTDAGIEIRAAALQGGPGPWEAYVWGTASPQQVAKLTLHYNTSGAWQQIVAREYPFEFSVPVPAAETAFRFFVDGQRADGQAFRTPESVLGATR